ncbi:MAG: 3-hydroxyacyl-CoA dehydrogenase NAD-binding domain-containing protein, partial [Gemmatimonadota bacterium]|nr:3-hydroxyacyl-CoA dehydrogenase NAD-binding domain-containing protein [Gemmatimonadota bacterium]
GLSAALDLLLTGKQIPSRKALRMGFADRVVPAELFRDQVRIFAVDLPSPARRAKPGMITRLLDSTPPGRRLVLTLARRKVVATTGGHYPAPLRILDVLRRTVGKSVGAGLEAEARTAAELVVSPVSKNLIHVFHMREATRKGSGVSDPSVRPRPVDEMGVLGAGVMGGGIAQIAAYKGIRVRMKDIRHDAITGGLQHARALFDKAVRRKKLRPLEADQAMERISGSLDYSGFRTADLVVEAVVERMEVKKAVLREVEDLTRPGSVLSTNTSSLSVDGMAEALRRPEDFCGIHFFNPVDRMPLVEIVRGTRSSDATVATAYAFALKLGKVPVVVGDGPGFLVNRILGPYLNESGHLLADGGSIEEVDGAAKAFGMPMGPLRLIDEVGIDVSKHAGAVLHAALGDRLAPSPVLIALGDSGRLGRKGGSGFYRYEKGREKGVDPSVYAALGATVPSARRTLGHREIRRRLVTMMINEAARALEEGVVSSAAAVDLAMIMGTGFPPFRGGLLRFADTFHLRAVLDRTLELEASHGPRFAPPALLVDLADRDKGFYEAFPE